MTVQTFIIEWETENLATLIVAEEALRMKATELRKLKFKIAGKEVATQEVHV